MSFDSKKTSIIIRTKNEERWLPRCLAMVYAQNFTDFEVIIVDNESKDSTLEIVLEWGIEKIVKIDRYRPGAALNLGIQNSIGKYLVFLSAHCVPYDETWLEKLIFPLESSDEIFGTYGRQLPLPLTNSENSTDLLSIFRSESKLQSIDYFFHNANSAIKRNAWEKNPFNEEISNLEDQDWAKHHLLLGTGKIFYNSEAQVYHHDGLHFSQSENRTKGVVKKLRELSEIKLDQLPKFHTIMLRRWISVTLFDQEKNFEFIDICLKNYKEFVTTFFTETNGATSILVCSKSFYLKLKAILNIHIFSSIFFLERDFEDTEFSKNSDILRVLSTITSKCPILLKFHPEAVFYYNPQYAPTSVKNLLNLIANYSLGDLDIVMLGSKINELTWIKNSNGDFSAIDKVLIPGINRDSVVQSYLGAGSIFCASELINNNILESNLVSIIDIGQPLKRFKQINEK